MTAIHAVYRPRHGLSEPARQIFVGSGPLNVLGYGPYEALLADHGLSFARRQWVC
ncbi:MAG TPA: hypothetical protein VM324_00800 [Egibacteraceae bacterium]|jgi:hypothetical protein|nr:hypothetical protein [Egibacteraceae bacterium]